MGCVSRGAVGEAPIGLTLTGKRSCGFSACWQLWQEMLPCHWAVPTQHILSAAPATPTVAPSPAPAAILQDLHFNRGSEAFEKPAGA